MNAFSFKVRVTLKAGLQNLAAKICESKVIIGLAGDNYRLTNISLVIYHFCYYSLNFVMTSVDKER